MVLTRTWESTRRLRRLGALAAGLPAVAAGVSAGAEPLAAPAFASAPSAAPMVPMLLNLVLVLALIVVVGWYLTRNRAGFASGGKGMRVVASQSLGTRERIVVLEIGSQQLVVGLTPTSINTLYVPPSRLIDESRPREAAPGGFAEKLRESMRRARS